MNPRPTDYKSVALPIELHQQFFKVNLINITITNFKKKSKKIIKINFNNFLAFLKIIIQKNFNVQFDFYQLILDLPRLILSVNEFKINLIDRTASSFPGIGISTKSGSQFVSKIDTTGIPNLRHSLTAVISRF